MAFKIALIGCGNIGSRHLQALKKIQRNVEIIICEPSKEAAEIAVQRYNEVPDNSYVSRFEVLDDYRKLPKKQDLVIVATSAGVRYDVTRWILENIDIKYMILEKVVFQQIDYFEKIGHLLHEKGVKAWVNCTRRQFDCYAKLREMLRDEKRADMYVNGTNWGMGCNSIHLLDIYKYVTGFKTYSFDNSGLDSKIDDSKRVGYKEFFGKFVIKTDKGDASFECQRDAAPGSTITFDCDEMRIEINEALRKMTIISKLDGSRKETDMDMDYTSNTTNRIVEQIIDDGSSRLADYEESSFLHKIMLECFLDHINKYTDEEVELCPIT